MAKKGTRRGSVIPDNESDSDRFIRVVTPRVNKAIKAIDVIGFCAGVSYGYTQPQVNQILSELEKTLVNLKQKFAGKKAGISSFQFKE